MKKNNLDEILVLITGRFNVLHPGHQRLLGYAKEVGTRLIVGVEGDNLAGRASHVSEGLRLKGIQNIAMVDEAFIYNDTIESLIKRKKPNIVVKGKEHENNNNPEEKALKEIGSKLLFSSGELFFSSSDFVDGESSRFNFKVPNEYINRHNISKKRLSEIVDKFKKLKVCVIGDTIVDEYIMCEPLGMSQEDPTIVITPLENKIFLGGAGIVASHAAGLGGQVDFISVIGDDKSGDFSIKSLENYGVTSHLIIDDSRPTTLKQRYRCKEKTMMRLSHLQQADVSKKIQNDIYSILNKNIKNYDLIVFSDFNYGCLPQDLVDQIILIAKKNNVFLAADSQSSSQFGDISRFQNMDMITPTEREARLSSRDTNAGLVVLCDSLLKTCNVKNIILKLAENGILIHNHKKDDKKLFTDEIIALNNMPKDTAGAGDSLLICASMAVTVGANIWEGAYLGSLAAAIQISRLGNIPLTTHEISLAIRQ